MNLQVALELQKKLTEKYLFANSLVLAESGAGYWGSYDEDISEYLLTVFEGIDGIGISQIRHNDFALQFYITTNIKVNGRQISKELNISPEEVKLIYTTHFVFQSRKVRPLKIGCSVGPFSSDYYGTLGCFVINDIEEIFLLSNRHVLVNESVGYDDDFIIQPGPGAPRGKKSDIIGTLGKMLPFNTKEENFFDAALAGPIKEDIDHIICINNLFSKRNIKLSGCSVVKQENGILEEEEEKVFKCGAESQITFGSIDSFIANINVKLGKEKVAFKNQIVIESRNNKPFSIEGDSGSIVVRESNNSAIGLLFAGNSHLSLANPLYDVLNELEVSLFIK